MTWNESTRAWPPKDCTPIDIPNRHGIISTVAYSDPTKQQTDDICAGIRAGCNYDTACRSAGIPHDLYTQWGRCFQTIVSRYPNYVMNEFRIAITRAMAECESGALKRIAEAAVGGKTVEVKREYYPEGTLKRTIEKHSHPDWLADAWLLEHALPNKWGRSERNSIKPQLLIQLATQLTAVTRRYLPPEHVEAYNRDVENVLATIEDFADTNQPHITANLIPEHPPDDPAGDTPHTNGQQLAQIA